MADPQETPTPAPTGTAVAAPARKLDLAAIESTPRGGGAMFLPSTMQECLDFATVMSKSDFAIPPKFRGNPGACLAVTIQASRWQADPFGVIQKAYVTKSKDGSERIAYEAQLVAAVVNTRANLHGRLQLIYSGEGQSRRVKVIGTFADTGEVREVETPPISKIHPKNSPLWVSDPDQQLAYYGMRAWGRRWVPEVLLGIYTPEELEAEVYSDAPRPQRPAAPAPAAPIIEGEGVVRATEPEPVVEAVEEIVVEPEPEPQAAITGDDAARLDEMRVPANDGENRAEEAAAQHGIGGEGLEAPAAEDEGDFRTSADWPRWEEYLGRAKEGLLSSDLQTEKDFDDYAAATKQAIATAELTDDEKDDLRARFVSSFLERKREMKFGRKPR